MRLPRWVHHLWANWNGYFWLPCPLCGGFFGGHEDWEGVIPVGGQPGTYQGVCPECTAVWCGRVKQ